MQFLLESFPPQSFEGIHIQIYPTKIEILIQSVSRYLFVVHCCLPVCTLLILRFPHCPGAFHIDLELCSFHIICSNCSLPICTLVRLSCPHCPWAFPIALELVSLGIDCSWALRLTAGAPSEGGVAVLGVIITTQVLLLLLLLLKKKLFSSWQHHGWNHYVRSGDSTFNTQCYSWEKGGS